MPETLAPLLGVVVEDQDAGRTTLGDLILGRPSLIAFFYTRCMNPLKCSRTIRQLAELKTKLDAAEIRAVLAGITYDPAFDSVDRLTRYGRDRGLTFSEDCRLLRTVDPFQPVADYLGLGVGYGAGTVNTHRIEWLVTDPEGKIVLSRARAHWDDDELVGVFEGLTGKAPRREAGVGALRA